MPDDAAPPAPHAAAARTHDDSVALTLQDSQQQQQQQQHGHAAPLAARGAAVGAGGGAAPHQPVLPPPPPQQRRLPQERQQPQQQPQLVSDLLTGMVTSACYTSLTYPVHRVKVLLQTQDANPRIVSGKVPRYSFVHSFARLVREQGVGGLWRGNTPYLLRHVPSISMSFAFKDAFRQWLPRPRDAAAAPLSALAANAAAGAAAGALSLALVYPFEFATVRLAADLGAGGADRQYGQGMMAAWLQAMRAGGALSCYQGFGVAVLSMAAYKALYFGLYDTAKALLLPQEGARLELSSSALLTRTGLAAATTFTAASITYPLDIIRKRLIVDVGPRGSERLYGGGSFRECVAAIHRREGLRGFYRFYGFDMVFRLGGGFLLVGYDLLRTQQQQPSAAVEQ